MQIRPMISVQPPSMLFTDKILVEIGLLLIEEGLEEGGLSEERAEKSPLM